MIAAIVEIPSSGDGEKYRAFLVDGSVWIYRTNHDPAHSWISERPIDGIRSAWPYALRKGETDFGEQTGADDAVPGRWKVSKCPPWEHPQRWHRVFGDYNDLAAAARAADALNAIEAERRFT